MCLVDCLSAGRFPVPGSWFLLGPNGSRLLRNCAAVGGGKDDDPVEKKEAEETKWFWEVGGAAQQ